MANKIILKDTSLLKNKKVGRGFNGTCYLTKDNKIYKEFHRDCNDYRNVHERLTNYHLNSFAMPETLVYDNYNKYIGYIRRYVEGVVISELSKKTNINDFILALEDFEKDLEYLSKEGLLLYDLNSDNILYNDKKLIAIDSDLYNFIFGYTFVNLKENLRELSNAIIEVFLGNYYLYNYGIDNLREKCSFYGSSKPSELLNYVLEELNKCNIDKLDTIEDYQKGLCLIRKK